MEAKLYATWRIPLSHYFFDTCSPCMQTDYKICIVQANASVITTYRTDFGVTLHRTDGIYFPNEPNPGNTDTQRTCSQVATGGIISTRRKAARCATSKKGTLRTTYNTRPSSLAAPPPPLSSPEKQAQTAVHKRGTKTTKTGISFQAC
jgi:hypothetical protein